MNNADNDGDSDSNSGSDNNNNGNIDSNNDSNCFNQGDNAKKTCIQDELDTLVIHKITTM